MMQTKTPESQDAAPDSGRLRVLGAGIKSKLQGTAVGFRFWEIPPLP